METHIKYTDYYPPAKMRTMLSLLEVYKNNNDIVDEAREKLFGSRSALVEELSKYHFDSKIDQTLANKIDLLVIEVANKSDEYLENLWFDNKDYAQLWWSLVHFVNEYPLRPPKADFPGEWIILNEVNPEELLFRIDKQVLPAVRIMLSIAKDKNEAQMTTFCRDAINISETTFRKKYVSISETDIEQLLDLWEKSHPLYYLALAICIVKILKIARKNGIDIENVFKRMEQVDLLSVIFNDDIEQKNNTYEQLKEWLPNIKTIWHACTMLTYIIYTQQIIKNFK